MAILNIKSSSVGHVGVIPNVIYIQTNNTVGEVQATGFLNGPVAEGIAISDGDAAIVTTKLTTASVATETYYFTVEKSGSNYSLVDRQSGGPTDAILDSVNTLAQLQAIDTTPFVVNKVVYVRDLKAHYLIDLASSETASGDQIVAPDGGKPGRWFKISTRLDDFALADTAASGTAYTGTHDEKLTAYIDGMRVYFKANTTNTNVLPAAATLDIQGIGPKSILRVDGNPASPGEIPADKYVHLVYNASAASGAGAFELVTQALTQQQKFWTANSTEALSAEKNVSTVADGNILKVSNPTTTEASPAAAIAYQDYAPVEAPTTGGTTTAYTVTLGGSLTKISAYAQGLHFFAKINAANTSGAGTTINVNGLGAQTILLNDGVTNIAVGDLATGMIAEFAYDGTNFQLLNAAISAGVDVDGFYATDGGAADAYDAVVAEAPTLADGLRIWLNPANANTGASTMALNGAGTPAIKLQDGSDPAAGDIAMGKIADMVYIGTTWQLLNPRVSVPSSGTLSNVLTDANIFVGSATNIATGVPVSGDLSAINTGAFTIANNAVTTVKILNANVTTDKIADLNVTTGKLADDAVTLAKMASGTAGNLITYDASGDPAAVATGSAGQVLTSNGAGLAPTMQDNAANPTATAPQAVNQVGHGFTTGYTTPVRWNGSAWVKAQADSAANAETQYIAVASSADDFILYRAGHYITGFTALTANTIYFVDPSTSGLVTSTEPSTATQVSKPILETIGTQACYVLSYRGQVIT